MMEPDDRLAGDPVWELFPAAPPPPLAPRSRRFRSGLGVALLVAVSWWLHPVLSITLVCLAAAWNDVRTGRQWARAIPDKAGGRICALFSYAWGAWKLGVAAFVMMFAVIALLVGGKEPTEALPAGIAAELFALAGFLGSAILTAAGLVKAFRSGMRVWIGEGINQARTLMLGMLIVGFTFAVLLPMCFLLSVEAPRAANSDLGGLVFLVGVFTFIIGGPVGILSVLDWLSRRVVADQPGKFGPKVPTVGRWDS
jgi:hypothetical protein